MYTSGGDKNMFFTGGWDAAPCHASPLVAFAVFRKLKTALRLPHAKGPCDGTQISQIMSQFLLWPFGLLISDH